MIMKKVDFSKQPRPKIDINESNQNRDLTGIQFMPSIDDYIKKRKVNENAVSGNPVKLPYFDQYRQGVKKITESLDEDGLTSMLDDAGIYGYTADIISILKGEPNDKVIDDIIEGSENGQDKKSEEEIKNMDKNSMLRLYLQWNGIIGYDDEILDFINEAIKKQDGGNPKNIVKKDTRIDEEYAENLIKVTAKMTGIDISGYDMEELKLGMDDELKDHGSTGGDQTNIGTDNPDMALRIVIAHMKENDKYYSLMKDFMDTHAKEKEDVEITESIKKFRKSINLNGNFALKVNESHIKKTRDINANWRKQIIPGIKVGDICRDANDDLVIIESDGESIYIDKHGEIENSISKDKFERVFAAEDNTGLSIGDEANGGIICGVAYGNKIAFLESSKELSLEEVEVIKKVDDITKSDWNGIKVGSKLLKSKPEYDIYSYARIVKVDDKGAYYDDSSYNHSGYISTGQLMLNDITGDIKGVNVDKVIDNVKAKLVKQLESDELLWIATGRRGDLRRSWVNDNYEAFTNLLTENIDNALNDKDILNNFKKWLSIPENAKVASSKKMDEGVIHDLSVALGYGIRGCYNGLLYMLKERVYDEILVLKKKDKKESGKVKNVIPTEKELKDKGEKIDECTIGKVKAFIYEYLNNTYEVVGDKVRNLNEGEVNEDDIVTIVKVTTPVSDSRADAGKTKVMTDKEVESWFNDPSVRRTVNPSFYDESGNCIKAQDIVDVKTISYKGNNLTIMDSEIPRAIYEDLTLKSTGKDDWNRDTFSGSDGKNYVDVDGVIHSMTAEGEPFAPYGGGNIIFDGGSGEWDHDVDGNGNPKSTYTEGDNNVSFTIEGNGYNWQYEGVANGKPIKGTLNPEDDMDFDNAVGESDDEAMTDIAVKILKGKIGGAINEDDEMKKVKDDAIAKFKANKDNLKDNSVAIVKTDDGYNFFFPAEGEYKVGDKQDGTDFTIVEIIDTINESVSTSEIDNLSKGDEILVIKGKYKGSLGVIDKIEDDGNQDGGYQIDVKMPDGNIRYLGINDISINKNANESKFSLINVSAEKDGKVDGYWVQDHIGDLKSAIKAAKETEKANNNKIKVAVVDQVSNTTPSLDIFTGLKRLDEGTWEIPDSDKAIENLKMIIGSLEKGEYDNMDRIYGDLYNVFGDDELFDSLDNFKMDEQSAMASEIIIRLKKIYDGSKASFKDVDTELNKFFNDHKNITFLNEKIDPEAMKYKLMAHKYMDKLKDGEHIKIHGYDFMKKGDEMVHLGGNEETIQNFYDVAKESKAQNLSAIRDGNDPIIQYFTFVDGGEEITISIDEHKVIKIGQGDEHYKITLQGFKEFLGQSTKKVAEWINENANKQIHVQLEQAGMKSGISKGSLQEIVDDFYIDDPENKPENLTEYELYQEIADWVVKQGFNVDNWIKNTFSPNSPYIDNDGERQLIINTSNDEFIEFREDLDNDYGIVPDAGPGLDGDRVEVTIPGSKVKTVEALIKQYGVDCEWINTMDESMKVSSFMDGDDFYHCELAKGKPAYFKNGKEISQDIYNKVQPTDAEQIYESTIEGVTNKDFGIVKFCIDSQFRLFYRPQIDTMGKIDTLLNNVEFDMATKTVDEKQPEIKQIAKLLGEEDSKKIYDIIQRFVKTFNTRLNEEYRDGDFEANGTYTMTNSLGYEIQINYAGDAARIKEQDGKVSDWLEIEYIPSTDDPEKTIPTIDPNGYNIPLDSVMKVNEHKEPDADDIGKQIVMNEEMPVVLDNGSQFSPKAGYTATIDDIGGDEVHVTGEDGEKFTLNKADFETYWKIAPVNETYDDLGTEVGISDGKYKGEIGTVVGYNQKDGLYTIDLIERGRITVPKGIVHRR